MEPTKVISLLQPWASAVVQGHKILETRSWQTTHRGLLLIHASKAPTARRKLEELRYWADFFAGTYDMDPWAKMPTGAIIGHAYLVGIQSTDKLERLEAPLTGFAKWQAGLLDDGGTSWPLFTPKEQLLGDYGPGRYAWHLVAPVVYPTPIPCRGHQSIWKLPDHLRQEVAHEMRQAADAMAKPDVQLAVKGIEETLGALRTFRESLGQQLRDDMHELGVRKADGSPLGDLPTGLE